MGAWRALRGGRGGRDEWSLAFSCPQGEEPPCKGCREWVRGCSCGVAHARMVSMCVEGCPAAVFSLSGGLWFAMPQVVRMLCAVSVDMGACVQGPRMHAAACMQLLPMHVG